MNTIFTMTTVPERLLDPREDEGIRPGLKTILDQTFNRAEVHLNVPWAYRYVPLELPEWLSEWQETYTQLRVYRTPDFGPITKIYPTILRVQDPDAVLITVDDDLIYMEGIIDAHAEARSRYPDAAIGYAGIGEVFDVRFSSPNEMCHFCTSRSRDVRVKIIEGYKTVSYKRGFFDDDLGRFIFSHWADDISLSAYLGYRGIEKIVLACPGDCEGSHDPRVESFPVVKHAPISGTPNGCKVFRQDARPNDLFDKQAQEWHKLGYLER